MTYRCPVPDVIRIEDDVELVAVPQENNVRATLTLSS